MAIKKIDDKFRKDMVSAANLMSMMQEVFAQDRIIDENTSVFLNELDLKLSEEKIDTFLNCFNRALSIEQGASITENKELVKENIKKKFQDAKLPLVDEVISLDKENRSLKQEGDDLRASRNKLSGEVGNIVAIIIYCVLSLIPALIYLILKPLLKYSLESGQYQ